MPSKFSPLLGMISRASIIKAMAICSDAAFGHLLPVVRMARALRCHCFEGFIVLQEHFDGACHVGEDRLDSIMQQPFHRIAQPQVFHDPGDKDRVLRDGVELAAVAGEAADVRQRVRDRTDVEHRLVEVEPTAGDQLDPRAVPSSLARLALGFCGGIWIMGACSSKVSLTFCIEISR